MKVLAPINENEDAVDKKYVDLGDLNLKPVCAVGSDTNATSGWYKVASSTLSGYGNQNVLYFIKGGYTSGYAGILQLEMRADSTSISCWQLKWLVRLPQMDADKVRLNVSGMTWTLYVYNPSSRYGRVYFTEISNRSITGGDPTFTITYYNSNTPESGTPTTTVTASDAGIAARAIGDKDGNQIDTTYYKVSNPSKYIPNTFSYVNIHPENSPVIIPFMNNDISFLVARGGSYVVEYDGVTQSINIDNAFDASPTYWAINPTGTTEIVITLTLHKTFGWSNNVYYDFGNSGWRAKNIKIEVMNSNYAQDVWTTKLNKTGNADGNGFVNFSHTPVGADNAGAGFNKLRFTFSSWNSATIFRIAQLGIYNYGSAGLRETNMSRGIDDYVYRSITPAKNNTYNLGSSSNKWANLYATSVNGYTLAAACAKGVVTTIDTSANLPTSNAVKTFVEGKGYTTNTGTVTSITVKGTSPIAVDSESAITTSGTRTISHANSGVTAGTYRSVTVNATGHVTAGTNPTTLSGYGITDAKIASGVITLGSNTITPLTASSTLDATKLSGTIPSGCYTDTKNTAGSTDSSSKLFLVGATSQAANPQTYSQDTVYAGTDGHLYSNSKQAVNLSDSQELTNKTYEGYTLQAACGKDVDEEISAGGSTNLATSAAVVDYLAANGYGPTNVYVGTQTPTSPDIVLWMNPNNPMVAKNGLYVGNKIYLEGAPLFWYEEY